MLRALGDGAQAHVRAIVEELAHPGTGSEGDSDSGPDDRRIGDLYTSFLDIDTIEANGTGPLRLLIDEIAQAPGRPAVAEVLGRPRQYHGHQHHGHQRCPGTAGGRPAPRAVVTPGGVRGCSAARMMLLAMPLNTVARSGVIARQ